MINQSLVVGDILLATPRDRCSYLGTETRFRAKWLADHPGSWRYVKDIPKEAGLLVKTETELRTVEAGPSETGDDEDDVVLVDTLGGDRSPPLEPTSLPTPVKADATNGSTKAELPGRAAPPTSEVMGPETETTSLGAVGRKRGRSGGRQLKKHKPRKLSPATMRMILDGLAEHLVKGDAAAKAGISRKTLGYWLKHSEAGEDVYDVEWRGETAKFHEHCESAMGEAEDKVEAALLDFAMGGVVYKYDEFLLSLGYEGPDAYLRDENGDPVVETVRKAIPKMMRLYLERKRPERWGKHRKLDVPRNGGVLVVGDTPKKLKNSTAASIRARKWKSVSNMIRKAKS